MKCNTCGCQMTQLFVSWVCDNCKPTESKPTESKPKNPIAFVYKHGGYVFKVPASSEGSPYCFGDFEGALKCLHCPVKAKCLSAG